MTDQSLDDAELRRLCGILERISSQFAADSDEALAIRDAAEALILVHQHAQLRNAYQQLKAAVGGALSEEMKNDLRRHRIDPDALENEDENG